jgi:TonB-linked SusC/RagA family outer membrane protein
MKNKYKMIFALQQYSVIRIFAVLLICFFTALPGFAQQTHVITGNVKDSIGGPLIGATVKIAGSKTGTITDTNGDFKLSVPNGSINLEVTYVGYLPQKISLGDKNYINIVLSEVSKTLDELVVVGYVTQKKATLTGSVSSIKNDELVVTKNENMVNMLTGKLPGVRVVQQSSQPGDYATTMDIRGMGTPLFVVDGVPRDQAYFSRMDAEEIDNISILKDGAASIYGLRAANGVVLITTKSGTSQNGKVDITYTSSYIMQQGIYVPHGINAQDYMTLRNEQNYQDFGGNYLIRRNPVFTQVQLQPYIDGTKQSYDWMRAVFNPTSPEQQHNLSINGGNDKLRYFFSLGYGKQMGNYTSGGLYSDNLNLRSNIDAQITKGLKARISIGSILTQTHQVNGADWSTYKETWLLRPDTPIYANDNPLYPNGDATLSSGNNMQTTTRCTLTATLPHCPLVIIWL